MEARLWSLGMAKAEQKKISTCYGPILVEGREGRGSFFPFHFVVLLQNVLNLCNVMFQ